MSEQDLAQKFHDDALDSLSRGQVEWWNRIRKESPTWKPKIRNNASQEQRFCSAQLDKANLRFADFAGQKLHKSDLHFTDFRSAVLTGANLNGSRAGDADFSNADMTGANLYKANLEHAKLDGARLHNANLEQTDIRRASLVGTKGLFGPNRAIQMHLVRNVESAVFARKHDKVPWSSPLLRSIGTLRLFGISNAAWIGIILYAVGVRWYNGGLAALQLWADKITDVSAKEQVAWIQQLPVLPVSPWLGWQLIMLVVLAIGATLYLALCPDLVKENTETKWTRELKEPLIEYRSAMFCRPWGRYICLSLYAAGGIYTLIYLAVRVWITIKTLVF